MTFIIFILSFILLLLLSSFFVVSFHHLTRHYEQVQPDNTVKVKGYLLKYWSYCIERIRRVKVIWYTNDALKNKYNELKRLFPNIGCKFEINETFNPKELYTLTGNNLTKDEIEKAEMLLNIHINNSVEDVYTFYIEEPIYYFPEWIRKPTSSCVVCMASTFGTAIWFTFLHLYPTIFHWSKHPTQCIFLFYIVFLLLLAQFNAIIYRKTLEYVL